MEYEIITYGGVAILEKLFIAISALVGSNGSLFYAFVKMGISIGFLWSISKAFFRGSAEAFFGKYFFPLLLVISILYLPCVKVTIRDATELGIRERQKPIATVSNVPFILGFLANFVNKIGYGLTVAIENIMHSPNDPLYNKTGRIFGAETSLESRSYIITNGDLAKNMKRFVSKCVVNDIQMRRYTLDDLQKSTDLYQFLLKNTSRVLGMKFSPLNPNAKSTINSAVKDSIDNYPTALKEEAQFKSCKEVLEEIKPYLEKEQDYYLKHSVLGNIDTTYKALTNLSKQSKELINQQLMIHAINDTTDPVFSFAKYRAEQQQRDTYHLIGAMAGKSLLVIRIIFEALIYCSFIFILPMFFFPGAFRILNTWIQMIIWIQLWPPFYAILNYIMQIISQNRANSIFNNLNASNTGLSIFTSVGIENLNADMFALAGYLSASIPFISYVLVKGGVSSFVHLAGSIMTPIHSAAGAAATEKVTGNYSYGNISQGNLNYGNVTSLQKNLSPSLSTGYATLSTGSSSISYNDGEAYIQQKVSSLRSNVSLDDMLQNSLQKNKQSTESELESIQRQYTESSQEHMRASSSLITHQAQTINRNDSYSKTMDQSEQASYHEIINKAHEYGQSHGIDDSSAIEGVIGAGVNFLAKAEINTRSSAIARDSTNELSRIASSEDFQTNLQNVLRYAENSTFSSSDDEGTRLTKEVAKAKDHLMQVQASDQEIHQKMDQLSVAESFLTTNGAKISANLNQEFVRFGLKKFNNDAAHLESILNRNENDKEKQNLYASFQKEYIEPELQRIISQQNFKDNFSTPKEMLTTQFNAKSAWIENHLSNKKREIFFEHDSLLKNQEKLAEKGSIRKEGDSLKEEYARSKEKINFAEKKDLLKLQEQEMLNRYQKVKEESIIEKLQESKQFLEDKSKGLISGMLNKIKRK